MEEPWRQRQQRAKRPEVMLCLFPHLKEFLVVDTRGAAPRIFLLNAEEIFTEEFFKAAEKGFSGTLRERSEHPLSHLMAMPQRVVEALRSLTIEAVLRGIGEGRRRGRFPRVAALMVTGAALHLDREHLAQAFRALIVEDAQPALVTEWAELMERLMGEEREALRKLEQEELKQALEGQSEGFYTLWDSHN